MDINEALAFSVSFILDSRHYEGQLHWMGGLRLWETLRILSQHILYPRCLLSLLTSAVSQEPTEKNPNKLLELQTTILIIHRHYTTHLSLFAISRLLWLDSPVHNLQHSYK